MNIVMITADDLNFGCLGIGGCDYPNISPNIDRLARGGFVFNKCYSNIALCQQSRSVQMTGLYPHNNGAVGFNAITSKSKTLTELFREQDYFTGILGKTFHLQPFKRFPWNVMLPKYRKGMKHYSRTKYGLGRNAGHYAKFTKDFLKKRKQQPFFLLLNSHDPHRPFPDVKKTIKVRISPHLPQTEAVNLELNRYYAAVKRLDKLVGKVMDILSDVPDTLIVFTSDHGMPFSFAKANCYPMSVHVPLIFNHPSLPSGSSDVIFEGVDLMPTICDIVGINHEPGDGTSLLHVIKGANEAERHAFIQFFRHLWGPAFSTRSVISDRWCYVRNFWWDKHQANFTLTRTPNFRLLSKEKKDFIVNRCKEEFYDLSVDPHATSNIIDNELVKHHLIEMKKKMLHKMIATNDPNKSLFEFEMNEYVKQTV